MKVSYKVLKSYIPDLKSPEEVAKDLVMHTAEVENIVYEGENLSQVFIGEVKSCKKHPESEKLHCTIVEVNGQNLQIVCGAANVREGLKVPVAVVGAKLAPDFVIAKTKIRGETSEGMICSADELGLIKERQEGILELPKDAPLNTCFKEYLAKNDIILEVDNKAINHRPDLFSHIGIMREIEAIKGKKLAYKYVEKDFSKYPSFGIINEVPEVVSRYLAVKIDGLKNIESPEYIKQVLASAEVASKGLLVDVSNYSLYLYGQPIHCFDADKIEGQFRVRYAKKGEKFLALDGKTYELSDEDIVLADDKKVLCLGGITGGLESSVSESTKSVLVEAAHFDQAVLRKTGKRLGIRTDALNLFEKDIVEDLQIYGASLVVEEFEKNLPDVKVVAFDDIYAEKTPKVKVPFDLAFMNRLIGREFGREEVVKILSNLGIELVGNDLLVPVWRKDLHYKADIAEEIARITGYDEIVSTIPEVESGAVIQDNIYKLKNDARNFFTSIGYFDMYNYSFVNEELMQKCLGNLNGLIPMKNALSEELTHLKGSLLPNLLLSLEKNIKEYEDMKLFEMEKVFTLEKNDVEEHYSLAGVKLVDSNVAYFEIQSTLSDFFKTIGVQNFVYETPKSLPSFAHPSRTASVLVRGQEVGFVGEIHPKVANNFDVDKRIGFFEINVEKLKDALYGLVKVREISSFQENDFDLNFVVDKSLKASRVLQVIEKTSPIITKVVLVDIYENKEKLPGKRALTYKIFIQSMEKTLDDNDKGELIKAIVESVKKVGGELRN